MAIFPRFRAELQTLIFMGKSLSSTLTIKSESSSTSFAIKNILPKAHAIESSVLSSLNEKTFSSKLSIFRLCNYFPIFSINFPQNTTTTKPFVLACIEEWIKVGRWKSSIEIYFWRSRVFRFLWGNACLRKMERVCHPSGLILRVRDNTWLKKRKNGWHCLCTEFNDFVCRLLNVSHSIWGLIVHFNVKLINRTETSEVTKMLLLNLLTNHYHILPKSFYKLPAINQNSIYN